MAEDKVLGSTTSVAKKKYERRKRGKKERDRHTRREGEKEKQEKRREAGIPPKLSNTESGGRDCGFRHLKS